MKKIIIFLFLIIPAICFSQSMYLKKLTIEDSISAPTGRINASEYYQNGIPFSAGGGDAYLGNRQTFSARNVFDDSLIANSYAEFDNLKLTNYINFLGDVISDIGFIKGANVTIGTRDNYSLRIGTNNDSAVVIDKNNKVTFIDTVKFDRIAIMDSLISKNLMITNAGGIIQWLNGGGSQIYQVGNVLYFKQNEFDFLNLNNYTIATIDSLNGFNLFYGSYTGDGSNLTNLNASEISSGTISDSRLPNTITPDSIVSTAGNIVISTTTEDTLKILTVVKIKNNSLIIAHSDGAKRAILSTNASGDLLISVNRAVAITGNLEVSGFSQLGESAPNIKMKLLTGTTGASGGYVNIAHSVADYKKIIDFNYSVEIDSLSQTIFRGYNRTTGLNIGTVAEIGTTNVSIYIPPTAVNAFSKAIRVIIYYQE